MSRPVPSQLVDRARGYLEGRWRPVEPRHAATVALVRDAAGGGIEVYLLRRVSSMAFAAGMYVFAGGRVDPRDADDVPWSGPDPAAWAPSFAASPDLTRALVCAAVRETFEEAGVVLAGPDASSVVADTTGEDWEADRQALLSRELAFSEMLRRRGLVLRAELLRPWAHWITPEFEERRYDTRFLVAALPPGQRTRDVGGEADRVVWMRPDEAVAGHEAGRLAMLPPTVMTLAELSAYSSVAEVLAAPRTISPILPRAVEDGRDLALVLPGEPGYPA